MTTQQNRHNYYDELRVVERTPIIELESIYGVSPRRDVVQGTVTNADGLYSLENQGGGDVTILDSAERGPYPPGQGTEPGVALLPSDGRPTGGTVIQFGYFGDTDGVFFEYDADGFNRVIFKNGVEDRAQIGKWAEGDIIRPTKSGLREFSPLNGYIYHLPFAWYGFGPTRFELQLAVQNSVNGRWMEIFEEIRPSGETSFSDPHQPVRVKIISQAGDPPYTAKVGGRQVSVIGRYNPNIRTTTIENRITGVNDTQWFPILAVRRRAVQPHALTNIGTIFINSTANIRVAVELNGDTPTGTWALPDDYVTAETLLEVKKNPGSTFLNQGILLQKFRFTGGETAKPSGGQEAVERTPLVEMQPLVFYVRRYEGETQNVPVTISVNMREAY